MPATQPRTSGTTRYTPAQMRQNAPAAIAKTSGARAFGPLRGIRTALVLGGVGAVEGVTGESGLGAGVAGIPTGFGVGAVGTAGGN